MLPKTVPDPPLCTHQKYLAECLGTFFLVFAGTGAIIINGLSNNAISHTGVGLTFGLVVMVLIYAIGPISGAHINPAVTLAFALTRRFPPTQMLAYWASQLLGALLASAVLLALFGNVNHLGATIPAGSAVQSLVLEFFLTFLLMFVIMSVTTHTRKVGHMAALAIGATVALEALFAGPICGASMNPARSFGPAVVGSFWQHHWIYWIGPVTGALCGAAMHEYLLGNQTAKSDSEMPPAYPGTIAKAVLREETLTFAGE